MTTPRTTFALIGRSFPSESFESLYQSSLVARRLRCRGLAWDNAVRARPVWRGSGEIVAPRAGRPPEYRPPLPLSPGPRAIGSGPPNAL